MSDLTPPNDEHSVRVSAQATFHSTTTGPTALSGAKSKAKPKQQKETKTKEFDHKFDITEDCYVGLLKAILAKHGEEKYNVTDKMTYSIKVQLPGVKKTAAVDIDDYDEYKELAKNIIEQQPTKMNIFVDMAVVEKRWSGRGFNRGSDNEDGEDAGLYDSNGLSEVDRELARLRRKLEVKYQNDHNTGYTYIDPETAESYELTPIMMKEWARAMYDGVATVERPVSLGKVTFHPAKRQVALHPSRIAAGVNLPHAQGAGATDIGHLANMITTLIGVTSGVKPTQPSTPQKPSHTQSSVPEVVNSPPVPTPSKLSRYLEHAETKLGVSDARMFETGLRENGYGPDILHLVDNKDLEGLGISKGNIIRLKAGAQNWWNSSDAKRKRTESESAGNSGITAGIGQDVTVTPSKRVAYEVRYEDGGSSRLFGPRLSPGPRLQFPDREVYYKNLERNIFEPIPLGYRPVFELQPGDRDPFARPDDEDVFGGGGWDDHPPPPTIPSHPSTEYEAAQVLAGLNNPVNF